MDFEHSERSLQLQARVSAFMEQHVYSVKKIFYEQARGSGTNVQPPILESLKAMAHKEGLWNLFFTGRDGPG